MDIWQRARVFAEEAAKRSQELTKEAARRSSELTIGSARLGDIVVEASRRSKDFAAETSKRADQIKAEAAKRAGLLKSSLADGASLPPDDQKESEEGLERFGITEELREFVKGITPSTFKDFPLQDDSSISEVPAISNIRQDLTEWQEKHASLVLTTVKEISKLRYEICPRVMRERKFWRIYFILVNSHVAPYENMYMEDRKLKSAEQMKDNKERETSEVSGISKPEATESKQQNKTSAAFTEQDLDVFLLGGDSDEGPDDVDRDLDDDFDKLMGISDEISLNVV